ncbi:unnamed protein product [Soboliphyme baturini]|uniref:Peptidase_M13_N domain-containing protein n=1 Tax=Soboliphyme baturini TaxID=241478 RepID=A0A183J6X8_9BILA|nr:unnamed protein product [Soboliphyme baturini]
MNKKLKHGNKASVMLQYAVICLLVVILLAGMLVGFATNDDLVGEELAASMQWSSIDRSTNPCQNFYKYACGKWMANQQVAGVTSNSIRDELSRNVNETIIAALDGEQGSDSDCEAIRTARIIYR